MEAVEELLFLLMVQRVSMAHVRERLLCFQGRKDDLVLGLQQGFRSQACNGISVLSIAAEQVRGFAGQGQNL